MVMTSTRRKLPWLTLGVAVAALSAGCSSPPDEQDARATETVDKVCGGLLGKAGSAQHARLIGGRMKMQHDTPLEHTRPEQVAAEMKKTVTDSLPEEPELAPVCSVNPPHDGGDVAAARPMEFSFGWIRQPLSVAKVSPMLSHTVGSARVDVDERYGTVDLYFTCRLPNESEGIVMGHWIGQYRTVLSVEETRTARIRMITAVGNRMATILGCTNDLGLSQSADVTPLKK